VYNTGKISGKANKMLNTPLNRRRFLNLSIVSFFIPDVLSVL
jgi:hypothetical protein